jgi:hypothetical protein
MNNDPKQASALGIEHDFSYKAEFHVILIESILIGYIQLYTKVDTPALKIII